MPFRTLHRLRWPVAPLLGVVATLGYAPYGQWYLPVLALALMFAIAARAPAGRAAFLGWLYGFAHYLTGIYWVYISTHTYGGAPAWLGALLMVALAAYLAAYDAIGFALAARLRLLHAPIGWVAVPALFVFLELLRGTWLFDGFPWLSYGELALDTPVAKLAPLIGVHGISALVVICALALQKLGVEENLERRVYAAAVFASPLLALALPMPSSWTEPDGPPITAALVQSDIRQDEKWLPAMRYEALSRHWRLTQQAWPASVVVWPEVALTQSYAQLKDNYLANLDQQAAARKATLLLGILAFDESSTDPKAPPYNSVIAVGAGHGRYDKRHLVPFGEFFPIPDFMRPLMDVLGTPYSDMAFGDPAQGLLHAGDYPIEVSICFEDSFSDEIRARARGSAFLVNLTNDAWFGRSSAPHQHLAFSRLRAMENGRWMLRAANTGISALINPDGEIVQRTKQFEQAVLRGEIQPRKGQTPYQQWGDTPLWAACVLMLFCVLWSRRDRFEKRGQAPGSKPAPEAPPPAPGDAS